MRLKDHAAIVARGESFRVDPRQLKIEPGFNIRDLDAPAARPALDELKESIRAEGVQVPLEIRISGDDVFVTSGHRRHKVVMELIAEGVEIPSVPAIAEPKVIDEADRCARLITLNAGEPLSGLEKAEVVRRLLGYGWDRNKIAQRLGFKTVQAVANYELMLAAPIAVKEAVRNDETSFSHAVELVRANGDNAGVVLQEERETAKANGRTRITKASSEKPSGVDKALKMLKGVVDSDPEVAASLYMGMKADELAPMRDWLTAFVDHIRSLEDEERAAIAKSADRMQEAA